MLPGIALTDAATTHAGIHTQRRVNIQTIFNQVRSLGGLGNAWRTIRFAGVPLSRAVLPPAAPFARA